MSYETGHYVTTSDSEEVLWEVADNFGADVQLTVRLAAIARATGGQGTFRVRIGGTPGVADGTIAAEIAPTTPALTILRDARVVTNPTGLQPLKLTGFKAVTAVSAEIKTAVIR